MMQSLPIAYQRVIAVGLLVTLLATVYILIISPYLSLNNAYTSRLDNLNARLLLGHRLLQSHDELKQQIDSLLDDTHSGARFIHAGSDALASAELQKHIKAIVTANRGNLSSMQVVKSQQESDLATVTIRVRMSCTITNMLAILHTLEAGQPVVTLDRLSFLVKGKGTRRKNMPTAEHIDISFDATGYRPDLKS
jgi:hypothetical protein